MKRIVRPLVRRIGAERIRTALNGLRRILPGGPRAHALELVLIEFGRTNPHASFIQIGSNDGVRLDPLRREILEREWVGVLVEPVPYVFERLRRNYSGVDRVHLENIAVSDHDGSETFYYLPQSADDPSLPAWYDSLGSFRKGVILQHRVEIPDIEQRLTTMQVPCLTFESLCRKVGLERVDLIHTDVEGYDYELLKLIDLRKLRPKLLIFEHYHLDPDSYAACTGYLASHGFEQLPAGMDTVCLDPSRLSRTDRRLRRAWDDLRANASPPAFRGDQT